MIKNRTIIEVEVKGREFRLECPSESTWEDVGQAITIINAFATERVKSLQQPQASEQLPVEENQEH